MEYEDEPLNDEDKCGRELENEDEDDDENQSHSSSYISDPSDSADEDAAYRRYLQRKEDRYLAKAKKDAENYEIQKEVEVQKAYSVLDTALKTGQSVPIGPMKGGWWDLYSTEYFAHYFVEVHLSKRQNLR